MSEKRERRAIYMFDRDQAELVIQLPLDEAGAFDADEVATWVGLLAEKVRPWAEPYRMAGVRGLRLEAGPEMQWRPAWAPRAPAGPAENGSSSPPAPEDAANPAAPRREAPPAVDWPAAPRREEERLYQLLLNWGGEHRPSDIARQLAALSPPLDLTKNQLNARLQALVAAGRVTCRKEEHEYQKPTYYRAVPPPEPGRREEPADSPAIAAPRELVPGGPGGAVIPARVVDWTQGKVMLFWGGKPPGAETRVRRIQQFQQALKLKAVRWPDYEPGDPYRKQLIEVQCADVDFMVVTLYNRHTVSHELAQVARARQIPVFRLGRTTSLDQLVHALAEQIEQQGLGIPALRVAA